MPQRSDTRYGEEKNMENMIYKAIVKTMADIGAIGKKDKNNFDGYMFRGIDSVYNALQPAMVKNGIFIIPELLEIEQTDRTSRKGEPMIHTRVTVRYTFFAEDGSSVTAIVPGEAMDRSDKSANKAMSAAYKYACFQTFSIPTEEFKDADSESPDAGVKTESARDALAHYIAASGRDMKEVAREYGLTKNTKEERFREVLDILFSEDVKE